MSIKVEFSCKMIDQDSVDKVNNAVSGVPGLKVVDVDLQGQKLLLELDVTSSEGLEQIQKQIESTTGFVTVLKGFGDSFSAVAELHQSAIEFKRDHSKSILGVARLTQLNNNQCLVDAVIDHLPQDQSKIGINIHQFGDLSHPDLKGAGLVHIPINDDIPVQSSQVYFKQTLPQCDLSACIGRSVVVRGSQLKNLAAGIIARASPVSGNEKKICLCSGKTIWQERQETLANQNPESHK